MGKKAFIVQVIILTMILTSCNAAGGNQEVMVPATESSQSTGANINSSENSGISDEENNQENGSIGNIQGSPAEAAYEITKSSYEDKGFRISYPQLTGAGRNEEAINKLVKSEALKGLNYYQGINDVTVEIDYAVELKTPGLLSIRYFGMGDAKGAAHPSYLFYTTNIDMDKGIKLRLSDIVEINEDLVLKFRDGKYKAFSVSSPELELAVNDSLKHYSNDELIKYFKNGDSMDSIGTETHSDTFSYLTKDSVGISIGVSHVAGDNAQLEISYSDLSDFLKISGNKLKEINTATAGSNASSNPEQGPADDYALAEELIKNYEYKLVDAINNNDFSLVEPYLLHDSPLYNSQKKLVKDLNSKGIKEEVVSYDLGYLTYESENTYKMEAVEAIAIDYPDKGKAVKEFQWIYTLEKSGNTMKLSDIKAWSTFEEDLLQREGRAKADGYYSGQLLYSFDDIFMDELNGKSSMLTENYIKAAKPKEAMGTLIQQLKAKGGDFKVVDSVIKDGNTGDTFINPVIETRLITIGYIDKDNNSKETKLELKLTVQEYRLKSRLIFSGYAEITDVQGKIIS